MEHLVIDDQVIVSEEDFADQGKSRLDLIAETAEPAHEIMIKGISDVQTQSVNPELLDPHLHAVQQIVNNGRILKIEFDKFKMSLPAFVPETVVVSAVPVEVDDKPVFVWGIPFFLLDIFESPETSSYMVEHAVQHDLYIMVMQSLTDLFEILVRSQPTVDFFKIPCVISVIVRFEDRVQDDGTDPQLLKIFRPFTDLENAVSRDAVVVYRRAAESDRIYLIKSFVVSPHDSSTFLLLY